MKKRSKEILEVIKTYMTEHEYSPSIPEICALTGITSNSIVNWYLEDLEFEGYIERDRRILRGIFVLPRGHS